MKAPLSSGRTAVAMLLAAALAVVVAPPGAVAADGVLAQTILPGTFGLTVGPDGLLYVPTGGGIVIVHPDTGQLLGMLGPQQGVMPPEDVHFGPDGSMYFAVMFTGDVGRRAPDGAVTTQNLGPGVNPIAFSPTGRMFVSEPWFTDTLYEVDPELQATPRVVVQGLGGLKGLDWGADGRLYGALMFTGKIVRIDVDTAAVETVASGLPAPFTAKFGPDGMLYVVERAAFAILRVDPGTGAASTYAELPFGPDNIAFSPQGRLFVSSYSDGVVAEVRSGGELRILVPGGLTVPGGLAVVPRADGGESVFAASLFALREYDGATGALRSVERSHFVPGTFAGAVAVGRAGSDLVTVQFFPSGKVQRWNPDTREVLFESTALPTPQNAIGLDGDLVVVDLGTGPGEARVVRLHGDEVTVLADASDGLVVPLGLAADNGDLFVGDWATGTIWKLASGGQPLAAPAAVATGLEGPEGMALDGAGGLLVLEDAAGRLSRVDLVTGTVRPVAGGLQPGFAGFGVLPPFGFLNGVAVGPSGAIYVTGASEIRRIEPTMVWVAGAVHRPGFSGTFWRTDLGLHNRGATRAGLVIEMFPQGPDAPASSSTSLSLDPDTSARVADVLDSLFGFTGSAALRVTSVGGDVLVAERTWTSCAGGGCSQFAWGVPEADACGPGGEVRLVELESTASHRTNVGLVNTSNVTMEATVALFMADGTAAGERTVHLQPYGNLQINDLFHSLDVVRVSALALGSASAAWAVVTTPTAAARFLAYASVVDNQSQDATLVPGR